MSSVELSYFAVSSSARVTSSSSGSSLSAVMRSPGFFTFVAADNSSESFLPNASELSCALKFKHALTSGVISPNQLAHTQSHVYVCIS